MMRPMMCWRRGRATLIVLGLMVIMPTAPSNATTLMTEDSGVFGESWTGANPDLVDVGYNIAGFMGAKRIRFHYGFKPWLVDENGQLLREDLDTGYADYYTRLDAWLRDVERRGFRPYLTLVYQPEFWKFPTTPAEELAFINKFEDFCGAVALRYNGRVGEFSVWNEPNNNKFGQGLETYYGARLYNTMFRRCYAEIKAVNPEARVYYGEIDAHRPNPCTYVYNSLWHPTVADGVAFHTYQWNTEPDDGTHGTSCQGIGNLPDWSFATHSWWLNGLLRTPSGGIVPRWITEHGYCREEGECVGEGNGVPEATRADYIRQAYLWAQQHGVEVFSYYHLFFQPNSPDLWDSGIVSRTGSPTASVFSLKPVVGGHGRIYGESDVYGDGLSDLVTLHSGGAAFIYPGRFDEQFTAMTSSFAGTMDPALADGVGHYPIDVTDVDGDSRDDLVTLASTGSTCTYRGTTIGDFNSICVSSFGGTMIPGLRSGPGHEPVAVADVAGDGRGDLISFASGVGSVYVYPGTPSGAFGNGVSSFAGTMDSALHDGVGHYLLDVVDVTGDGRGDLVTLHSNGTVYVYPGLASNGFGDYVASFGGSMNPMMDDGLGHEPVGVADVNGDRRADLVTVANGSVWVYPGLANGKFTDPTTSFQGTFDSSMTDGFGHEVIGVLDVNGDGYADLLTSHSNGSVYLYRGLPSGAFDGPGAPLFGGTLHGRRAGQVGHEFAAEKPWWRRLGCTPSGCH